MERENLLLSKPSNHDANGFVQCWATAGADEPTPPPTVSRGTFSGVTVVVVVCLVTTVFTVQLGGPYR